MSINQIILELRKEKGLSQQQVANAVGISQSTIAKIEINRNEATASTIRKLADFFNVSADYLLERSDDFGSVITAPTAPALSKKEEKLLRYFRSLSSELQEAAIETTRVLAGIPAERNGLQNKA